MRTIKQCLFPVVLVLLILSCQKDYTPGSITSTLSTGSLASDASGNCSPATVNGIYKKDSVLNSTHFIDVSVNVTATGNYLIYTDTTNGIYFKDSSAFTSTGLQTVRLKGFGKPLAAGTTMVAVKYNMSSCVVQLLVTTATTLPASFTLNGAPGNCISPVILGTYKAGTPLTASNKIQLGVTVATIGNYTLTTSTVDGISFTTTGTFVTTGPQTVNLSGTGTPVAAGTFNFAVNGTPAGCSFPLTVLPATVTTTRLKRIIQSKVGSPQAYITTLTYDAAGRVVTFNEWREDSSFTPVKIVNAAYSALTYNGAAEFPIKNTITNETGGIDSTLYTYDAQNRVTQEEWYYNGQVNVRNTYAYLSASWVLFGKYIRSGTPSTLQFRGNDSLFFDAQKRIIESRSYNQFNVYNGYWLYQYDNQNSPLALIKMFDHAFTLYCDDAKFFYRSPNNLTGFTQVNLPSGPDVTTVSYTSYNAAGYPLTGTATVTNGTSTENFRLTYEYY